MIAPIFKEDPEYGYRQRTIKNAMATVTFAIASNFYTSGEILTKKSVLENNRIYIPIDISKKLVIDDVLIEHIIGILNGITREYTPDNIEHLHKNEIFVFGSNAEGIHGKGAALTAKQKFGAIQKQSRGLQGQSYAIVTKKDWRVKCSSTLEEIESEIQSFIDFSLTSDYKFLVTKLGSENAGYSIEQIKSLFEKYDIPDNVILPKEYEFRPKKISVNIAGNGIYTLNGLYSQEQIDLFVFQLLKHIIEHPKLKIQIKGIRSGGQTGADEAGIKAAIHLGIPSLVYAPRNWKFRNLSGDIENEFLFKKRFE